MIRPQEGATPGGMEASSQQRKALIVLDAVDAALVRALQGDGRATYQALADRVGLSRTAVRARVRHLIATGAIRIVGVLHAGGRVIVVETEVRDDEGHLVAKVSQSQAVLRA